MGLETSLLSQLDPSNFTFACCHELVYVNRFGSVELREFELGIGTAASSRVGG